VDKLIHDRISTVALVSQYGPAEVASAVTINVRRVGRLRRNALKASFVTSSALKASFVTLSVRKASFSA
jgi:hypothetical protein